MSWYRPQEWISVPDRLFFRSHRDGAAAPVPGCLCGVGKGTSPAPPRASPAPPCAAPAPPCALPHPHASHSLCTSPAPPRTPHAAPHCPCSPAPSLTHTPPTPSAPSPAPPRASPAPPRTPHAAPRFPCTALRPPSPTYLPLSLHLPLHRPAPPTPPCAALASFPGPRTDAFPATSPPSSGKFAKAVRPVSHFLLLFLHFLPQFRRFGPRNPKKRQLFCVFMQFDQNIRKNKALFQGLTLHFFLYFPGLYVVLLVLISRHGEIKKKRV